MACDEVSSNTRQRFIDLDKLLAEKFGRDGDGGDFRHLEDSVAKQGKLIVEHDDRITNLETVNIKVTAYKAAALALGGVVLTLAMKLIEKLL